MAVKLSNLNIDNKKSHLNNNYNNNNMYPDSFLDTFKSSINEAVIKLKSSGNQKFANLDFLNFDELDNTKAFDDPATIAGGGNLTIERPTRLRVSQLSGGAFIGSGINYEQDYFGSAKLNGLTMGSQFGIQVCGTPITNEASIFSGETVTPVPHTLWIKGCEDLLARTPNPNELLSQFTQALEYEKLILSDDIVVNTIIDNAGTIALEAVADDPAAATNGLILAMAEMIGQQGKWATGVTAPKFYMNHVAFRNFISQRDANGRFQHSTYQYQSASTTGAIPASGLVGHFGGYEIILVGSDGTKGIRNTYTVTVSNVVDAKVGGTNTLVLFGHPEAVTLLRGPRQYDVVKIFANDHYETFSKAQVEIGARTHMDAGIDIPARFSYYAFTA